MRRIGLITIAIEKGLYRVYTLNSLLEPGMVTQKNRFQSSVSQTFCRLQIEY